MSKHTFRAPTPESADQHAGPPTDTRPSHELNRRVFLRYIGAGAGAALALGEFGTLLGCAAPRPNALAGAWLANDGTPTWKSPPYPVPLPSDTQPVAEDRQRFATYEVLDDLLLPDGFQYEVLARWGERFGPADQPEHQIHFGYNNDYTGLVPVPGSSTDHWLLVNHEYVSLRPYLDWAGEEGIELPELTQAADRGEILRYSYGIFSIDGWALTEIPEAQGSRVDLRSEVQSAQIPPEIRDTMRQLSDRLLAEQGVSILRVRQREDGGFEVLQDSADHKRIATQSTQNIPLGAEGKPPFRFTGPTGLLLDEAPQGTFCNCSGGVTPWGTFLTCEENVQYQTHEGFSPEGELSEGRKHWFGGDPERVNGFVVEDHPRPTGIHGTGHAATKPLDGRHYGWVCEIDPNTGGMSKHTALGRFRHENVCLRAEAGKPLAAYMGDDRRGGHVWKFVSAEPVQDPEDPRNSELLQHGTLYVARFEEGYTGRWVPLEPDTPLRVPEPQHCPTGHMRVPARPVGGFVAVGDTERDAPELEVAQWQRIVEQYAEKPFDQCTLGDLVWPEASGDAEQDRQRRRGVLLMEAFAMANCVGGTPTARPEDIEIHPQDHSVFIAFTDATDSSDGSPDQRIFPDSRRRNSRQYGAVYRLVEDDDQPGAQTFTWGRLVSSGEVAEDGGGFACADNLVFDQPGNLWMVTDITTSAQNFPVTREGIDGTRAGDKQFPGVFGNNSMFVIPTQGPQAGIPHLFAIGPVDCELCGPTFANQDRALILAVQHPGEHGGTRRRKNPTDEETFLVHDRDNQPFEQQRKVPRGSNFPSGKLDSAPRPCVVCITRKG